jgi:hypothetical protein
VLDLSLIIILFLAHYCHLVLGAAEDLLTPAQLLQQHGGGKIIQLVALIEVNIFEFFAQRWEWGQTQLASRLRI